MAGVGPGAAYRSALPRFSGNTTAADPPETLVSLLSSRSGLEKRTLDQHKLPRIGD
jgi:hypothetical protein